MASRQRHRLLGAGLPSEGSVVRLASAVAAARTLRVPRLGTYEGKATTGRRPAPDRSSGHPPSLCGVSPCRSLVARPGTGPWTWRQRSPDPRFGGLVVLGAGQKEPRWRMLRQITMRRTGLVAVHVALLLTVTGCTGDPVSHGAVPRTTTPARIASTPDPLPEAIRAACGHPGRRVVLIVTKFVISRRSCDLRGVKLVYAGIEVIVPDQGRAGALSHADGPLGSSTTSAMVDVLSGDVTFQVS